MTLHIRPAQPSDRPTILALAPRLQAGVAPWREPGAVAEAVEGWVRSSLDRAAEAEQAVLVAELDRQVVGFVTVSQHRHWAGDTDAYIGELVVAPDAEGRGIGKALVRSALDWARMHGYTRVVVATGAANHAARRLYALLGFDDEDVTLSRAV